MITFGIEQHAPFRGHTLRAGRRRDPWERSRLTLLITIRWETTYCLGGLLLLAIQSDDIAGKFSTISN
jgi:hypothetical protein